jgi:P-type conjugative transfer protein TrbJ
MRSRRLFLSSVALAAAVLVSAPPPAAQAQMAVIDLKAILQAEQQVSQGLTQIQRLESQLTNQAAMLQHLETDVTGPIAQITGQATAILLQAQGIGYNAQNAAQQYATLYPTTMSGATLASTQASLATWRQNNTLALQDALQMQNRIAQGQPTMSAQVASAVTASQGATGQTAAIQASNQLLATVSAQLTQLQNLLITQARAEQTLAAQAQASQAAGAADSQRFWATPTPASRVQNPGQL